MSGERVSVVIPAYNAAATIDETLRSVRSQTHADLEILVVDDGSRDATCEIVLRHSAADPRVRLVRQENAGVAAARNSGWRQAAADLIAFVDADDLWAPTKIEAQLAALHAGGEGVGLVYCWYAMIDAAGVITFDWERPEWQGEVFEQLCRGNFIGNGSAALVRRRALEDAGGFEPALRAAGAQGCEDILFYLRVARHHRFAVVTEHLVGYRQLPENMSSDMARMLRSWLIVAEEMRRAAPESRVAVDAGTRGYYHWLVRRAMHLRQPLQLARVVTTMVRHAFAAGIAGLLEQAVRVPLEEARKRWRRFKQQRRGTWHAPDVRRFPVGALPE